MPQRTETLQSGETRCYVPREVLNEAKRKANGLATKNDAAELSLTNATLAREVVRELTEEFGRHSEIAERQRREAFEKIEAIHESLERAADERSRIAYAVLVCVVLITLMAIGEIVFVHLL